MRVWIAPLVALLGLTACSEGLSEEEQRIADEADIATVESLQDAPPIQITPEAIRYPDIEKNEIYGASCAFAPEDGGLGAIVIAMAGEGFMKINGQIERFAPDVGSDEQQLGTRAKYDGSAYSFRLEIDESDGESSGYETTNFAAHLTVRDSSDEIVFAKSGTAQCGT